MEKKLKILGLITARGGSKRIPRKNVKDFLGKPLLAWTAESGLASKCFDRFVLTTDDPEIAEVGKHYGVEVPFMRPPELATDTATSYQAVRHAVEWLKEHDNFEPDWVILLEPTSPSHMPFHIEEVRALIEGGVNADSIIGISKLSPHYSYLKQFVLDEEKIMKRVVDGAGLKQIIHRNQDVPVSYYINSVIYAFKTTNLYDGDTMLWGNTTYGYEIDSRYAIDIDTPEDWELAKLKMEKIFSK